MNPDTPQLTESSASLLYLVILLLYEEGVNPSCAEILFKLKEHNADPDLCANAFVYYSLETQWYDVFTGTDTPLDIPSLKALGSQPGRADNRSLQPSSVQRLDVAVYLRTTPPWWCGWTNPKDPHNYYSPQLWNDLVDFFVQASPAEDCSTRYELAKTLKASGPLSIQALRLGDITHVIQLAIKQGYLIYDGGALRPAWAAVSSFRPNLPRLGLSTVDREEVACVQAIMATRNIDDLPDIITPCSNTKQSPVEELSTAPSACQDVFNVATVKNYAEKLASLKRNLCEILDKDSRIILSQVRDIYRMQHDVELNPEDFGYSKLSDLLTEECGDICGLVRLRNRHVFLERKAWCSPSACSGESAAPPEKVPYYLYAQVLDCLPYCLTSGGGLWTLEANIRMRSTYKRAMCELRNETNWGLDEYERLERAVDGVRANFCRPKPMPIHR